MFILHKREGGREKERERAGGERERWERASETVQDRTRQYATHANQPR